ncbi:DUF6221 family protein [Streptomyces massasporeus]|uniref:DUF6221 family protein n=1 Tax=Streptomyces massasporeus TaxID=67324 RepID=UPI0037032404
MDDLVRWLGEQLDEDERITRAAGGAAWEELPVSGWVHTAPLPATEWQPPGYDHHVASAPLVEDRAHIVAHDPARVLREIDAKRQVLAKYVKAVERIEELATLCERLKAEGRDTLMPEMERATAIHRRDVLHEVLRLHALPYVDRPGFRDEWRP